MPIDKTNDHLEIDSLSQQSGMLFDDFCPDIFLLDDNPENLRLLSTVLREHGCKVRTSIKASMAFKAIKLAKPDLILLDIRMPELNGYEVCEKLKAESDTANIPVIFISATDEVVDKVKAFEVGGADQISKPFERKELLVRVKTQLTIIRLQKQVDKLTEQNAKLLENQIYIEPSALK